MNWLESIETDKHKHLFILLIFLCFSWSLTYGQDYQSYYQESLKINKGGMMVLGSWAVANMTLGAVGWSQSSGQGVYFHQMNFFWNSINLAIAGFALYGIINSEHAQWSQEDILNRQLKTQNLYLINAGLDIGYMGIGLLLKKKASGNANQAQRLTGYGNSVILQGAFLFVFDLIMYGLQQNHRSEFLNSFHLESMNEAMGLSLCFNW